MKFRLPRIFSLRVLFWSVFFAMVLSAAAVVGGVIAYVEAMPPARELVYYAPPESTEVFDQSGTMKLAEFAAQKRYLLSYDQIPPQLIQAFLSIEDKRFYEHCGIDPIGVARALVRNIQARRKVEGASTITMQLVGNTVAGIDRTEITMTRKIDEAMQALLTEKRYTKEQIIEFYLNQIYLGSGAFGVEAAAQTYFRKSVGALTLAECAMLAGIPQQPSRINPAVDPTAAIRRRNQVLRAMRRNGYISDAQYDQSVTEPLPGRTVAPRADSLYKAPYFIDYMTESLKQTEPFVAMAEREGQEAMQYFKTGGFTVRTTLDPQLQRIAEECVREGLKEAELQWHANKANRRAADWEEESRPPRPGQERIGEITAVTGQIIRLDLAGYTGEIPRPAAPALYNWQSILKEGELLDVRIDEVDRDARTFTGAMLPDNKIKSAMVVLEARTGRVLALVGGDDYFDKNEKKAEWNYAIQGGRQPGSGIKPLFYAAAIHAGMQPSDTFLNEQFDIGNYRGRNYSTLYEGRMMTLQEGLERSQNVMMLRVFQALGFRRGLDFVRNFDFAWQRPQWEDIDAGGAAACLGTFDVTPLELAAAYTVFANEGIGVRPYAVEEIRNRKGEVIYTAKPDLFNVLTPQQAYIMTSMMRGVFSERGTARDLGQHFRSLEIDVPQMAGKTGTTSEVRDAWFNGFTPDLAVSVFVGFDPPRPLGGRMTGSTLAGPIWQNFMQRALELEDRQWTMQFAQPPGLEKKLVNLATGAEVPEWRQDQASDNVVEMFFIKTNGL